MAASRVESSSLSRNFFKCDYPKKQNLQGNKPTHLNVGESYLFPDDNREDHKGENDDSMPGSNDDDSGGRPLGSSKKVVFRLFAAGLGKRWGNQVKKLFYSHNSTKTGKVTIKSAPQLTLYA